MNSSIFGTVTKSVFRGVFNRASNIIAFALNILGLSDKYGNVGIFTRAGVANVMDYTGTLVSVPTDVHRVTGGHKVENLISFSEDMTSGVWRKTRNATASAPDTLNFTPATSSAWGQYDVCFQGFAGYQGQETLSTFTFKGIAGETYSIFIGMDGGAGISQTITLTPQWKTYAFRVGAQVLAAPAWGPAFYISRQSTDTVTTMQIKNIMVSDVTGKPANYIPPYVQRLTAATAVEWFDNESGLVADANGVVTGNAAGNPLHPKRIINGQSTYLDVRKYATATVVPAGGSMEDAGRWYTSALGGTTAGATLLADVGVTDWVDNGIYNRGYGVLLEGNSQNNNTATNWRSAAGYSGWAYRLSAVANQIGIDGVANTAVTLTDTDTVFAAIRRLTYNVIPIISDTNTHTCSVFIKKGSGNNIVRIVIQMNGGTYITAHSFIDTSIGKLGVSSDSSSYIEDYGDFWRVSLSVTNNGTNTLLYFGIYPAWSTILDGPRVASLLSSVIVDWPQVELNSNKSSSPISGSTVRQNELGNLKFPTTAGWKGKNAFPHVAGSLAVTYCPQYSSRDFAGWKSFLSMYNINKPIGIQSTGIMRTNDGTNATNSSYTPIPNQNDAIQVALRWGVGADAAQPKASMLLISIRNATTGAGWTHGVAVPYDGAFDDRGFLQFLANLGGNNSVFRNTAIFDRPLTNNELQGYVIK